MNVTNNISSSSHTATQTTTAQGNAAQNKGAGTALDQLLAFLSLLTGQAATTVDTGGAGDAAAKNAAGNADTADSANGAASTDGKKSRASLTSDLSSPLPTDTQYNTDAAQNGGASSGLVADLTAKADALASSGKLDAETLEKFRADAITEMKAKGLDDAAIDKNLASIASQLGDKLSAAQSQQLTLPLAAWAPAINTGAALASSASSGDLSISKDGRSATGTPAPAAPDAKDSGVKDSASTGPSSDTSQNSAGQTGSVGDSGKGIKGQTQPAQINTGAQGSADPNNDNAASVNNNINNNVAGDNGAGRSANANTPPGAQTQGQASSAAAGPAGNFDGGADSGRNFSSGQQNSSGNSLGDASGLSGAQGAMQPVGSAAPQNFVNYMTAASQGAQTPTTQLLALQIQRNAKAGTDTFTMQLDPAELGRLEIRMKFDKAGGVTAHVSADKPETLALLQKDAPQLHRLLQQAGLTADNNALSFDLRQQGQQHNAQNFGSGGNSASGTGGNNDQDTALQAKLAVSVAGSISQGGVNIVV